KSRKEAGPQPNAATSWASPRPPSGEKALAPWVGCTPPRTVDPRNFAGFTTRGPFTALTGTTRPSKSSNMALEKRQPVTSLPGHQKLPRPAWRVEQVAHGAARKDNTPAPSSF